MGRSANNNVVPIGGQPRARSAPLSAQESAGMLGACRGLALERMARALSGMLDHVEEELYEAAEKAVERETRDLYLDARAQARANRTAIESGFRRHFVEVFNRKVRGEQAPAAQQPDSGELKLLEPEALEEDIAVRDMSLRLRSACEGELFALSQRVGFLLGRPELADEANPMGPAAICAALRDACDQIEAGFKVRVALLRQLERHAEAELQRIYHDVNEHLVAHQILPDVRARVRRNPPAAAREAAPPAAAGEAPKDVFNSLAQLLAGAAGKAPGAPQAAAGASASAADPLLAQLTRMQREGTVAPVGADGELVNTVRGVKAASGGALAILDAITIDLVALLFDFVFEDRHIPAVVKALLGRLQIPTLKVALIDKGFFAQRAHPARRLIDALAQASIGLDENNARGGATVKLIEEVVEYVRDHFETDLKLFESQVARVEKFMEEQKRAEQEVVRRSAQLIERREREEAARATGDEEVRRRLRARAWVPPPLRAMLTERWSRALAAALLAEGEGSPAWHGLLRTMDELLWSVEPKSASDDRRRLVTMLPGLIRDIGHGLERAHTPESERLAFLGDLVDCHAAAVRAGLRGLAALPVVDPPEVAPPPQAARIERSVLPAGGIEVEEIRLAGGTAPRILTRTGVWTHVQRGTWVEFAREGAALRARLTWISPNKGVYLFTNPVSETVAVSISPEALAEQMRRGEARMLNDAPLTERAVDSMFATLRGSGS